MKKIIFSLTICLLIAAVSYAQNDISYGIKGGLNYSNLVYEFEDSNNDFLDFNAKVGFYAGGFINISLSDKFALQPELLYSSQGAKLDIDYSQVLIFDQNDPTFLENEEDVNVKQSKLLLPVLLQYKIGSDFSLFLGPQITYTLNFETEVDSGDELVVSRFQDDDKIGIDVSARLGYKVSENMMIELGYFRGLTNQNSVKSSVFQLGLAHKL
ncbi:porin family protein [uncultured Dokdonia sp.]|uniref:porin family protein n=1 Tax=uncultured Dokdonia sp. TaxID=575653 RepID=UPI002608099A|nr:porin family protein [uncultured Dokdonia sp.]